MKMFNDIAKKMSDLHSQPKAPKLSLGAPEASDMGASKSNASGIEAMHSELADKICPDCHSTVKEALTKHGLAEGSPDEAVKAPKKAPGGSAGLK